jgi:hypothetical protein
MLSSGEAYLRTNYGIIPVASEALDRLCAPAGRAKFGRSRKPGQLETVELAVSCSGKERVPLRARENEDRPVAVIFGVAHGDAVEPYPTYLETIAVKLTVGTLSPGCPSDVS